MKKSLHIKAVLVLATAAFALAACDNNSNTDFNREGPNGVVVPTPPPVTDNGPPQDQVGAGFAASFNQAPFDEPTDPITGDIGPIDKSIEPIPIPDP